MANESEIVEAAVRARKVLPSFSASLPRHSIQSFLATSVRAFIVWRSKSPSTCSPSTTATARKLPSATLTDESKKGVNPVLEFQIYEQVASILSSKFNDARIPIIASESPHPG